MYLFQRNQQWHPPQFRSTEDVIQKNSAWLPTSLVCTRCSSFTRFIMQLCTLQESSAGVLPNSLSFSNTLWRNSMSLPLTFPLPQMSFHPSYMFIARLIFKDPVQMAVMKSPTVYQCLSSLCCCSTFHSLYYTVCHKLPWFLVHLSALPLANEVLQTHSTSLRVSENLLSSRCCAEVQEM